MRSAHIAVGGVLDGEGLFEPGRMHVLAEVPDLFLQRLVRREVLGAEEREHLFACRRRVGAEEQVPLAGRGQEVVRVAAEERKVDPELGDELGRHQAKQVGPRRSAEPGSVREGMLGLGGAPDGGFSLQDAH